MVDQATRKIGDALRPPFKELGARLKGDYGGVIEHLWIDLELIEGHARLDGTPRHPFRFQKRVSGRSHFGLPSIPDSFNVGHFSVRPDFGLLTSLPMQQVVPYVLTLIYRASEVLLDKRKKLGGFEAALFRERLLAESSALGYDIKNMTDWALAANVGSPASN